MHPCAESRPGGYAAFGIHTGARGVLLASGADSRIRGFEGKYEARGVAHTLDIR